MRRVLKITVECDADDCDQDSFVIALKEIISKIEEGYRAGHGGNEFVDDYSFFFRDDEAQEKNDA